MKKGKWTPEEDILLIEQVLEKGNSWSSKVRLFNGTRTEHMIKNRYKSLLHKERKTHRKSSPKKLCEIILEKLTTNQKKNNPEEQRDL